MSDIREFCPLWGEWELDRKLGEGSFGTVWKVKRNVVGGRVYYAAVKHISIPKDDSEVDRLIGEGIFSDEGSAGHYYSHMLQSIMDEIDAMHKLQGYTNIVTYEDHKVIPRKNGIGYDLFLRMELLTPLTERIRLGMKVSDVVSLGKDIATAIHVLSEHNMIHRDIKPQNIFVNDKSVYKLGDYGTARALGTGATAMSRKGTYNYMSPEIYNNQKADIRADIYSLGLVLYRLLNGNRLPFLPTEGNITSEDSDMAVTRRVSGEPILPPKYADEALSAIVLRACAFRPEDRYPNAMEMFKALEAYQDRGQGLFSAENEKTIDNSFVFSFSGPTTSASHTGSARNARLDTVSASPKGVGVQKTIQSEPNDTMVFSPTPGNGSDMGSKGNSGRSPAPKSLKWILIVIAVLLLGGAAAWFLFGGSKPTPEPTVIPTEAVTEAPTEAITEAPTEAPTEVPTEEPTETPTEAPTEVPTEELTEAPTEEPTEAPTEEPTEVPTEEPTEAPTEKPTEVPTEEPTEAPTEKPTRASGWSTDRPAEAVGVGAVTDATELRAGPSLRFDILMKLEKGTEVELLTIPSVISNGTYYQVRYQNQVGYISAPFIEMADGNVQVQTPASVSAGNMSAVSIAGDIVEFGRYEQDNNEFDGQEPIEWIVLDVQEDRTLLISRYLLDAQQYHTAKEDITWENCTLRQWLNSEFLDTAFNAEEKQRILLTHVDNSDAQGTSLWETTGGNDTEDRIFLLSYTETWKYFDKEEKRKCKLTKHAEIKIPTDMEEGVFWWLRSPGSKQRYALDIDLEGTRHSDGVQSNRGFIRPALWISNEGY